MRRFLANDVFDSPIKRGQSLILGTYFNPSSPSYCRITP